MCALTHVPRFRTVARFLSASERSAARALWEAVILGADDAEDADVAEAARAWGFAEH
jgi:alkylhydroperoxidase family enzyme